MLLAMAILAGSGAAFADNPEPTVYVIKKGDTLWGLSDRFIKDPHYWPNMWAANNPGYHQSAFHLSGQQVKVYKDRIVLEPAAPGPQAHSLPSLPSLSSRKIKLLPQRHHPEQAVPERIFPVQVGWATLWQRFHAGRHGDINLPEPAVDRGRRRRLHRHRQTERRKSRGPVAVLRDMGCRQSSGDQCHCRP